MSNALHVIQPYRFAGLWVFDDARHGLVAEPFVSGSSEIIDELVNAVPAVNIKEGFRLFHCSRDFPGAQCRLERVGEEEQGGYWYRTPTGDKGWLCPATLKYYPDGHPEELFVKVEAI